MNKYNKKSLRLSRYSASTIVKNFMLTASGLSVAWYTYGLAISGVTRGKAPEIALSYVPNESRALASKAERLLFENPKNPKADAQRLARQALENQILNPSALRTLGYYQDATGHPRTAQAYIEAAQQFSRRDAGAQIWLLDHYARSGDAKQALRHYDVLLKTQPTSQDVLFPRLLIAIADPNIRNALKPFLEETDGWGSAFLSYAIITGKNLQPIVDLMIEGDKKYDKESSHLQKINLLQRLINQEYYIDAKRLFLTMNGVRVESLSAVNFMPSDVDQLYGPMGWQKLDIEDAGADFVVENNRIILKAFVNPNTTRTIARKLLYLSPGNYTLTTASSMIENSDGAGLRWNVSCSTSTGVSTVQTVVINAPTSSAVLSVPQKCSTMALNLVISGGQGRDSEEALITRVSLKPTVASHK